METKDEIEILYKAFVNRRVSENSTGAQVQESIAYDKLVATMNEKQKELLSDLLFSYDGTWLEECANAYRNGFQTGMRLLANVLRNA